jgi:radical SAM peptide maturase (CXXX-repeat target family)
MKKINYAKPIRNQLSDNITFVITDDCNLRCKYCYEKNKSPNIMSKEMAKKCIDYFFDEYKNKYDNVVFDFIGGEPFTCIELLEYMTEYIIDRTKNTTKWEHFSLNACTNGTFFNNERVQKFITKYQDIFYVSTSIDGCKTIHDMNRNNSYDSVMNGFDFWKDTYGFIAIKATLNHEAIPYLYESIKNLINLDINAIYMNTIFENVWEKTDPDLFYEQLIKAADYILDNKLYKRYFVSLFDINTTLSKDLYRKSNWCGCGSSMIAVDYNGDLFPCLRFKTLSKMKPFSIGNIDTEIDYKKLLPFYFCHNLEKAPDCKNCEAQAICPTCTAFSYDETGSIFNKVGYMCEMHKARKRANDYYWNKMAELEHCSIDELRSV